MRTRRRFKLVAADSWEWFRHDAALEGGAVFRAQVADRLVRAGWGVRSGTGDRGRYFEVHGVPEAFTVSFGQVELEPVQSSALSHSLAAARHVVPELPGACTHAGAPEVPLQRSVVQTLPSSVHAVPEAFTVSPGQVALLPGQVS